MSIARESLAAWVNLLGPERAITDDGRLAQRSRTTFRIGSPLRAWLMPRNTSEVVEIVKIASQFGSRLYPISTGLNWGYGSSVPPTGDCALVDLHLMNSILDFSEQFGSVTVQPGVTFAQMEKFLLDSDSLLEPDMHGGPRNASLVGNALERGLSDSALGHRAASVMSLEAVLPNAETLRTGYARFGEGALAGMAPYGLGPDLTQMFMQSNLGIVTSMTFRLERRPHYQQKCVLEIESDQNLPILIDALQVLRADRWIDRPVKIVNHNRVLDLALGTDLPCPAGLSGRARRLIADTLGIGAWMGIVGLPAQSEVQARETRRELTRALKGTGARMVFLGDDFVSDDLERLRRQRAWFEVTSSEAFERHAGLRLLYREKAGPVPSTANPDQDRCGLIWVNAVVPLDGGSLRSATNIVESICATHGFGVDVAITIPSSRYAIVLAGLIFDCDRPGFDHSALKCRDDLRAAFTDNGFPPYRLDVGSMASFPWPQDGQAAALQAWKAVLDPHSIMAPGRYEGLSAHHPQ